MPATILDRILLIEVGGTHTRCAVARTEHGPEHVVVFDNADHTGLESVVAAYLDEPAVTPPSRAALAVAASAHTQPLHLTNIGWTVDTGRLRKRFGWTQAIVVNDFEALACAIPVLTPKELLTVRRGAPTHDAALAVLGPGTGLGVSGLVPCGDIWYPISGEGGHVTLAPSDDREMEIVQALRRKHGHVSAERVLSGPGLLSLYRLLTDNPRADSPSDVSRLADAGDQQALDALELFFRFLGTFSADVALTLGARGGVYLGGGILPLVKERLMGSGFRHRFVDKGRFNDYLEQVPVYLILAETPALRGLSLHPRL